MTFDVTKEASPAKDIRHREERPLILTFTTAVMKDITSVNRKYAFHTKFKIKNLLYELRLDHNQVFHVRTKVSEGNGIVRKKRGARLCFLMLSI